MSAPTDLTSLDRMVEQAVAAEERAARTFEDAESPLEAHRTVSGLRAIELVATLPASLLDADVVRGMSPWLVRLLYLRLSYPARRTLNEAKRAPLVRPLGGEARLSSWEETFHAALTEPAPRVGEWFDHLAMAARPFADRVREVESRLGEVESRIKEKLPNFSERPSSGSRALAQDFLDRTDGMHRETFARGGLVKGGEPTLGEGIVHGFAREATPSFPSRLTNRWLEELFQVHTKGLTLRFALPRAVAGASSFALLLANFGRALRRALAPRTLPFVVRRSPKDLDGERFAALFGALAASSAFHRRVLGTSPDRARSDARCVMRALLCEARLSAARVVLAHEPEALEDVTRRLFQRPMPEALRGAWPLARLGDESRFLAYLDGPSLDQELVELFGDDWFKNPRAFEWMRARATSPADTFDETKGSPESLAKAFERALFG